MTDQTIQSLTLSVENFPRAETLNAAREKLQDDLTRAGSMLARSNWNCFDGPIADALAKQLARLDPVRCIAKAWGTARELRRLGAESLADPGRPRALPLGKHEFSTVVHPLVTVRIDAMELDPIRFTVRFEAAVETVILIVEAGRLTQLEAVQLGLKANLLHGKTQLLKLIDIKWKPIGPHRISGDGIALVAAPVEAKRRRS